MKASISVQKWRNKAGNEDYNKNFMRDQRKFWRMKFLKGEVKYEDVPKSYRYWTKKEI